jgi:group II intron reverse transcriptase/maturase
MHGIFLHENREILASPVDGAMGRIGKADGRTPMMNDSRKSDGRIVPVKLPNKVGSSAAEAMEGRRPAKGNMAQQNAPRTQRRTSAQSALDRVREAARKDKRTRFTALFHHLTVDRLRLAFHALQRRAAAGIDGVTWEQYQTDLESNLQDLHERLHRGAYRAKPSRRVYIPKPDGRQRPLGVAALEDKIVQRAVVEVLNAIYEVDFLGFSYGFRPGRSQHMALDALAVAITRRRVNWVLDADIRDFYGTIDHGWLIKFIEHRVADRRVIRLIQKWLRAGVLEDGVWTKSEEGTPQGATVSCLLANIYLHYVYDLWVHQWRGQHAQGELAVVRYADDTVVGFEHYDDAARFGHVLRMRLRKFGLELHPDKTRLIRFGKFAAARSTEQGKGKPKTFDFLGFKHICAKTRSGKFMLARHTVPSRMRTKLRSVKLEMRQRMHQSIPTQGAWLRGVVHGYFAYHAVPTNIMALAAFRTELIRYWHRTLRRRSQHDRTNWNRTRRFADRWLPRARVLHPWPHDRFDARTRGKSPVR